MTEVIGFSGTRMGMTHTQENVVQAMLEVIRDVSERFTPRSPVLHHGDCLGSDMEAHVLATTLGYGIEIHPPSDRKFRAFCQVPDDGRSVIHKPREYLTRNADIARSCTILLATPGEEHEVLRSGTWSTIRYAEGKAIVIYPEGNIERR